MSNKYKILNSNVSANTHEFLVDEIADIRFLLAKPGSTAIVAENSDVYICNNKKQWVKFNSVNGEETVFPSGKITITEDGTDIDIAQYAIADVNVYNDSFKAVIERTAVNPTLPNNLTSIGNYVFQYCNNLALTSLPSGVTSIGTSAFQNCDSLALTSLPSGLTSIGTDAFRHCVSLTLTSLPSSLTSIGAGAFYSCRALTTLTCEGIITSLGSSAFAGSNTNKMMLTRVEFPNMALNTLDVTFGSSIEDNACQELEIIDIGNTEAIAASAFANCKKLQTLVLRRSDAICALNSVKAFTNTPMRGYNSLTGTIYVPSALIETYKTASNWSTIFNEGYLTFAAIEGSEWDRS